jgi:hypothetical protein
VQLPNPVAAGSLLLVAVFVNTDTQSVQLVTDTLKNSFQAVSPPVIAGGTLSQIWYAGSPAGGTDTVSVELSGAPPGFAAYVHEYAGIDLNSPVLGEVSNSGTSMDISPGPLFVADSAMLFVRADVSTNVGSIDTPFVGRETCWGDLTADDLADASGTYQAFLTATASGLWSADMVALKPLSSSDAGPPSAPSTDPLRNLRYGVGCGCVQGFSDGSGGALAWITCAALLNRKARRTAA